MKKKCILAVFIVLVVLGGGIYVWNYINIYTLDFSLLKTFSHKESYWTVIGDFPVNDNTDILVEQQKALVYAGEDGFFYCLTGDKENNSLFVLDSKMATVEQTVFNRNTIMLFEYENSPLAVCKKTDTKYSFILYDFETDTEKLLADDVLLGEYPSRIFVKHGLAAVQDKSGDILIGFSENGFKETGLNGNYDLLGIIDEKNLLVFEEYNSYFSFGVILKYNVENGEFTFLRTALLSGPDICAISPDGEYLVAHKIIRNNGIFSPVIFDLDFPVSRKYKTTYSDYNFAQFIMK